MKTPILEQVEQGIATFTLNRPATLNSYDLELLVHLQQAIERCSERDDVRLLILKGSGSSFCSGPDIGRLHRWLQSSDAANLRRASEAFRQILLRLRRVPQLTIAVINGVAADGGLNLALSCDFHIASSQASVGYPFIELGLSPELGTALLLSRTLGPSACFELLTSGRLLRAEEAVQIGLLNRQVPANRLESAVAALKRKLLGLPPIAVRNIKKAVHGNMQGWEQILEHEMEARIRCFQSEDCREGLRSFLENKKPHFRGE